MIPGCSTSFPPTIFAFSPGFRTPVRCHPLKAPWQFRCFQRVFIVKSWLEFFLIIIKLDHFFQVQLNIKILWDIIHKNTKNFKINLNLDLPRFFAPRRLTFICSFGLFFDIETSPFFYLEDHPSGCKWLITSWWLNQPSWKISVKLDHLPKVRDEHKKCIEMFETTT